MRICPPKLATLCPRFLCPWKRNPDEVPDAHGLVMLPFVDELHSFYCQQRRMDTILEKRVRLVRLPNAHPTHPSWELKPSWPSQPALALHRPQSDVAIALLVLPLLPTTGLFPTVHNVVGLITSRLPELPPTLRGFKKASFAVWIVHNHDLDHHVFDLFQGDSGHPAYPSPLILAFSSGV